METALVATWPRQDLLPAVRRSLTEADEALLCVAFANVKGLNLLVPQLSRLGGDCRMVVTSAFGGETTAAALALAVDLNVRVRVLNTAGGTFHPKLYLARNEEAAVAIVGSANLTGGLVTNVEAAMVVKGTAGDDPIAHAWEWGEVLWNHPVSTEWALGAEPVPGEQFDPILLGALREAIPNGSFVRTLASGRPNTVVEVTPQGVYVETERSLARGAQPQLVPAWMIQLAWDYLQLNGELTNTYLLATDGLNVKRSSAVCALLARLPQVEVASVRPITLRMLG